MKNNKDEFCRTKHNITQQGGIGVLASGILETNLSYQKGQKTLWHVFVSVRGKAPFCVFLPEGQETSLHMDVSVRGIVLEDTHCVPLFSASAIFSLNNWIQI